MKQDIRAENSDRSNLTANSNPDPTQPAAILMELAFRHIKLLFHSADQTGYADIIADGHRETWPIQNESFRRWLTKIYYADRRTAVGSEALKAALSLLQAKAQFDGPECAVNIRIAGRDRRIYIDLADDRWRAVEIDASGWRIVDEPPVRFCRYAGTRALPAPEIGGSIHDLRQFLNVRDQDDLVLVASWILAAFRPHGPYPLLGIAGEQGSAKTALLRFVRALVDPSKPPLRAFPTSERDLAIAAKNNHVLAFDNVSDIPASMSDALCRLSTGGGYSTRQLYTDVEEVLIDATCPVMLNGIEDVVSRPDLADRAVLLTLEPISDTARLTDQDLTDAFERQRPKIFGALLDAVVTGLNQLPRTKLPTLPRMADFAQWSTACETAFGPPGTFMRAFENNQRKAVEAQIDASPIATLVRKFIEIERSWEGTATELLKRFRNFDPTNRDLPKTTHRLGSELRRCAPALRKSGISVDFRKVGHGKTRIITLASEAQPEKPSNDVSAPSASSAFLLRTEPSDVADDIAERSAILRDTEREGISNLSVSADSADAADAEGPINLDADGEPMWQQSQYSETLQNLSNAIVPTR